MISIHLPIENAPSLIAWIAELRTFETESGKIDEIYN